MGKNRDMLDDLGARLGSGWDGDDADSHSVVSGVSLNALGEM
jgi:hypothetical protein